MRLPSRPVRIAAAVVLLAVGLVGLVAREGVARANGQEVRLAITGYDPRSLLTGHYVQFQLVDRVPPEQVCVRKGSGLEPVGVQLWLAARRVGSAHRLVAAAPSRAAALRLGEVAIRGDGLCVGIGPVVIGDREVPETISATLDIGIDRIHLDQEEAQRLEKVLRGRDGEPPPSWAVVSVGGDGKARLKGVIVGDRRIDLSWF